MVHHRSDPSRTHRPPVDRRPGARGRREGGVGTAAGLALLALVVTAAWLARLATTRSTEPVVDLASYYFPTYVAYFDRLARGELLRWNPFQACGFPWLGTLQAGFFYPPHVLYLVLPTHQALFCSTTLHLLLTALGTAAFARRLGLGWAAAAAGALAFSLHGPTIAFVRWPYLFETTAWLPLGCLAVLRMVESPTRRSVACLGAVIGMSWLAGGPQATAYSLYVWGTLAVTLLVARRPSLPAGARVAGAFTLAVGLGTLAGMVALLPARELAAVGLHAAEPLGAAHMFPMGRPEQWALLRTFGPGGIAGFTLLGWIAVPLALAARPQRAIVLWCLGLGTIAFLFAFGPLSPVTFDLYRALPVLPWFRVPLRLLVVTTFCLSLLTAIGLQRGLDALGRATARLRFGRALRGGAAVALAALPLWDVPRLPRTLPYDAGKGAAYRANADFYQALARAQGSGRVWIDLDLTARLATRYGVRSFMDSEPLPIERQALYARHLFGRFGRPGNTEPAAAVAGRANLLHLAAVRYLVVHRFHPQLGAALRAIGMRPSPIKATLAEVLENPRARPRAFVTYRTRDVPVTRARYLAVLANPAFDPMAWSIVEGLPPLLGRRGVRRGHPAKIVVDEPERVEIETTLAAPGVVVLADTFGPGWEATVDGEPATILPTNFLFRGVPTPPGSHRIRFEYRSRAVPVGAALTAVAWLVLGLFRLVPGKR